MQDKALDAMAKKYKEEMMRLYAHNASSERPSPVSQTPRSVAVTPQNAAVNEASGQTEAQSTPKDLNRLMHPPMPQIPTVSPKCEEKPAENAQTSKFPSPDEILATESLREMAQGEADSMAEKAAQTEDMPRFDSARGQSEQEHEQGNYDFTEAERQQYSGDGEGYLKLEVSGGGQPLDCALAAVFRVTDCGDLLVATFFTDQKGETEVITLPVLDLDEKYTVTVAKEGFYTVHSLEIPIFDSIKSIQPVELKCEKTE